MGAYGEAYTCKSKDLRDLKDLKDLKDNSVDVVYVL